MKTHDLTTASIDELQAKLNVAQVEYARLREAVRMGKEKNHGSLRPQRATIARIKTILRQKARVDVAA